MPVFLRSGIKLSGKMSGLINGNCIIDKNSAMFFNTLSLKLLEMSETVEKRIEVIKKNCNENQRANGFLFASIDTPQMNISVGSEYVIYVQRYGPPPNGKFEPAKLELIRKELLA